MAREDEVEAAMILLQTRLCDPTFSYKFLSGSADSNYSKLKFIVSSSVTEECNNSILLLGPRGSGKSEVVDLVLQDLLVEYPDMISVIRLNGLLHCDDSSAWKEIAMQLCVEHELLFSNMGERQRAGEIAEGERRHERGKLDWNIWKLTGFSQ